MYIERWIYMKTNAELKREGKRSLEGNWGLAIFACVVVGIITGLGGSSDNEMTTLESILSLISLIISGPLTFGLSKIFLNLVRSEKVEFKTLFAGFSFFLQTFVMYVLKFIFIMLWFLLLIIPGFIAIIRYSMSNYIMIDNPGIGGLEAIRRSKEMMHGHKARLFNLWLSFLGWFIFGIITFGLGFLFTAPYYSATLASFYEDLKNN
jgi:uncharacterized membrane protein